MFPMASFQRYVPPKPIWKSMMTEGMCSRYSCAWNSFSRSSDHRRDSRSAAQSDDSWGAIQ